MADLKTDYKDDVLDTSANQLRKYQMITNDDGTVSFVDVTTYKQTGDNFGAKDINDVTNAINDVTSKLVNVLEWHPFGTISPKDDKTNYDITIPQCNEIRVVIDFVSGVHRGSSTVIPYNEITDAEKIHYIGGGTDGGNYSAYMNVAVSKTYIRVTSLILNGKSMFNNNATVNLYYR